jgi:hypothetical protein
VTGPSRRLRRHATAGLLAIGLSIITAGLGSAAETVKVSIPAAIGFAVTNVSVATPGSPASAAVSFSQLTVNSGRVLRISVKADSDFVPPGGAAIPASRLSWTTSSASNGSGSSGVLSTSVYGQVFQSASGKKAGGVNVSWSLAAPGTPLRAGTHTLTVRWKLESINP